MSSKSNTNASGAQNSSQMEKKIEKELLGGEEFKTPEERAKYINDPKNIVKFVDNFFNIVEDLHNSMREKMGSQENYDKFIKQVFPTE